MRFNSHTDLFGFLGLFTGVFAPLFVLFLFWPAFSVLGLLGVFFLGAINRGSFFTLLRGLGTGRGAGVPRAGVPRAWCNGVTPVQSARSAISDPENSPRGSSPSPLVDGNSPLVDAVSALTDFSFLISLFMVRGTNLFGLGKF